MRSLFIMNLKTLEESGSGRGGSKAIHSLRGPKRTLLPDGILFPAIQTSSYNIVQKKPSL